MSRIRKIKTRLGRVKIHKEGKNILVVLFCVFAIFSALIYAINSTAGIVVGTICAILYLGVVNFFRSPKRHFTGNPENVVVSSVDGKVVALEETFEDEYLKQRCIQLSVFMNIFNVHANWFPVDGEVIFTKHHKGRFMSAWLPKASTENERSTVVIRTPDGQHVLMRQVAGAMARRIVTYAKPGNEANIEDHMGFIKFGSRVDLYLPLGTEIYVKLGQQTIGGITEVGRLHPEINNEQ